LSSLEAPLCGVRRVWRGVSAAVALSAGVLWWCLGAAWWTWTAQASTGAKIIAVDAVALPGETVYLEGFLYKAGVRGLLSPPVAGEVLRFYDDAGRLLGEKLTDRSGSARVPSRTTRKGLYSFTVRVWENDRYEAGPAKGFILARDKAKPLFLVEAERALAASSPMGFVVKPVEKIAPAADAPGIVRGLPGSYEVVYLSSIPRMYQDKIRAWLVAHGFPDGPLVSVGGPVVKPSDDDAVPEEGRERLRHLCREGARASLAVVGSRSLAKALVEQRVRVFLLEPAQQPPASHWGQQEPSRCTFKDPDPCRIRAWKDIEPYVRRHKQGSHPPRFSGVPAFVPPSSCVQGTSSPQENEPAAPPRCEKTLRVCSRGSSRGLQQGFGGFGSDAAFAGTSSCFSCRHMGVVRE